MKDIIEVDRKRTHNALSQSHAFERRFQKYLDAPKMPKIHKTTTIITFPLKLVATCLYFSLSKITISLSTVIAEDVRKDTAQNTNVMKKHVTRE